MKALDLLKALGVALAVLTITVAASFPMVAVYAHFIEPGHPAEYYQEAAQWIAPWSSHVLGPLLFGAFNYVLARRTTSRPALPFAVLTVTMYLLVELAVFASMGATAAALKPVFVVSLAGKLAGAVAGAWLGSRRRLPR